MGLDDRTSDYGLWLRQIPAAEPESSPRSQIKNASEYLAFFIWLTTIEEVITVIKLDMEPMPGM